MIFLSINQSKQSQNQHWNYTSVNTENRSSILSSIVPRNAIWNKVNDVNGCLRKLCKDAGIPFIDYGNSINPKKYLNNSKLTLIRKVLVKYLYDIILCKVWQS